MRGGRAAGHDEAYTIARALETKGAIQHPEQFLTQADMIAKAIVRPAARLAVRFLSAFSMAAARRSIGATSSLTRSCDAHQELKSGSGAGGVGGPARADVGICRSRRRYRDAAIAQTWRVSLARSVEDRMGQGLRRGEGHPTPAAFEVGKLPVRSVQVFAAGADPAMKKAGITSDKDIARRCNICSRTGPPASSEQMACRAGSSNATSD